MSGNGVLDAAARNGAINQSLILNINDRSCLDLPDYVALGCDCWFIGTEACPSPEPLFCRQCTKVGGRGPSGCSGLEGAAAASCVSSEAGVRYSGAACIRCCVNAVLPLQGRAQHAKQLIEVATNQTLTNHPQDWKKPVGTGANKAPAVSKRAFARA